VILPSAISSFAHEFRLGERERRRKPLSRLVATHGRNSRFARLAIRGSDEDSSLTKVKISPD